MGAMSERSEGHRTRPFSPETEADAIGLINSYIDGWPYSRPIDADLVAHWKTLGERYQPENMLTAYRAGAPIAFAHGERDRDQFYLHLLALAAGAVGGGVLLLGEMEARARSAGAKRLCGPTALSGRFYGGYVLGLEPYHPHWATDVTDAFVQASFVISQSEALMVADLTQSIPRFGPPAGYEIVDGQAEPEFKARVCQLVALHSGREVATCGGRLYPELQMPTGGPVGQLGFVGTDEAHRGKGLATALVSRSLARLQEWGARSILVSTGLENTPALRAYEKAGFRRKHNQNEWSKALA